MSARIHNWANSIAIGLTAVVSLLGIGLSTNAIRPADLPFVSQVIYVEGPLPTGGTAITVTATHRWGYDMVVLAADGDGVLEFVLASLGADKFVAFDEKTSTANQWAAWRQRYVSLTAMVSDASPIKTTLVWPGT